MILSDREIRAALSRGAVRITPDPPAEAWSSTALDLRLAKDLLLWKRPSAGVVEFVVCRLVRNSTSSMCGGRTAIPFRYQVYPRTRHAFITSLAVPARTRQRIKNGAGQSTCLGGAQADRPLLLRGWEGSLKSDR